MSSMHEVSHGEVKFRQFRFEFPPFLEVFDFSPLEEPPPDVD